MASQYVVKTRVRGLLPEKRREIHEAGDVVILLNPSPEQLRHVELLDGPAPNRAVTPEEYTAALNAAESAESERAELASLHDSNMKRLECARALGAMADGDVRTLAIRFGGPGNSSRAARFELLEGFDPDLVRGAIADPELVPDIEPPA